MATKRSGKTGRKQTRREAQIVGDKLRIFDTRFTRQSGEGGRGRERADRSCGDLAALVLVSFDRSRFHRAMKEAERLAPASAAELADAIVFAPPRSLLRCISADEGASAARARSWRAWSPTASSSISSAPASW
jgi:hypothetical protein